MLYIDDIMDVIQGDSFEGHIEIKVELTKDDVLGKQEILRRGLLERKMVSSSTLV